MRRGEATGGRKTGRGNAGGVTVARQANPGARMRAGWGRLVVGLAVWVGGDMGIARAEGPTTAAATQAVSDAGGPVTRPSEMEAPAEGASQGAPSTGPAAAGEGRPEGKGEGKATGQADRKRLPTPAELIEQIKARQKEAEALPKVAFIELSGEVSERPAPLSLFRGGGGETVLSQLLERLKSARENKDVRALVMTLGPDTQMGLSQACEIRDVLASFRKTGKRTFVYADSYNTVTYLLASGASDVVLLEGGELEMPGVGLQNQFYKGLLDKIGVKGDYVQIGEYKGAEEPFTRSEPSPELKEQMTKLADGLYTQLTKGIAEARQLPVAVVQQSIDEAIVPARAALDRKLVDHLSDRDSLRRLIEGELGTKQINVLTDYDDRARGDKDVSNPLQLFLQMARKAPPTTRDTIAVLYVQGTIVDGESGGGGLPIPGLSGGTQVGSETIRKTLREIGEDENVKAIVVRIDSPGGSALASEVMWQAVRRAARDRAVIVSVGDMAASGGYYLASAGDHIVAEPTSIVGSIGVVGGKFVLSGLFEKLGIGTQQYLKGRNADLYSSTSEWSERQRRLITNAMRRTYEQFTDRVMTTRRGKIADIDAVARGRIFVAAEASKLGMVDELGGLDTAIARAAEAAALDEGTYDLRSYPEPRGLSDLLGGLAAGGGSGGGRGDPSAGLLGLLPVDQRKVLGQQLGFLHLLSERPVILAAPVSVWVR